MDAFDQRSHHLGLGATASTLKGLLTVGPVSKQLASPVFEKPSDIGTDDLIGSRNHSTWTQNDYTGGEFQEDWRDPAMFAECVSMLPDPLGRGLRSTPPIRSIRPGDVGTGSVVPWMDVVDGNLFVVFNNSLVRGKVVRYPLGNFDAPNGEYVDVSFLPAAKIITAATWNLNTNRLWIGSNEPKIHTFEWVQSNTQGNRLVHAKNYGVPTVEPGNDPVRRISGLHLFGKIRLAVTGHGSLEYDNNRVWVYVSGEGTAAKWASVGLLPGYFVDSATYNNSVYILTRSGNSRGQLSMTQGDTIFPVLDLPYSFRPYSLCEYAGRLYIGGVGYDLNGDANHGELYEVNGTSLRLVRTWAGEVSRVLPPPVVVLPPHGSPPPTTPPPPPDAPPPPPPPPPRNRPVQRKRTMTHMRSMVVHEGLLWMPDSSDTGLEAYDATTDAFYGGPRSREGHDSSTEFTRLVSVGASLVAWGTNPNDDLQGLYRTETWKDSGGDYDVRFTTSDFGPEPAREKVWSRFTCLTRGQVRPDLFYSVNAGVTWTALTPDITVTHGTRLETSWNLATGNVAPSRTIRFKLEWSMTGSTDELQVELLAHSVSFLVRGDSKRRWTMTVNASEGVADRRNDLFKQDPQSVADHLWAMHASTAPVVFRDIDGTLHNVVVSDLAENRPVVDDDKEAYFPLTLIEV